MYVFYVLVAFFLILVAYAGWEESMRLVAFAELQVKYAYVRVRLYQMKRKLERDLGKPPTDWSKFDV